MLMRKNLNVMTLVLLIVSLLLELACLWLDVSRDLYRIIVVRYIFALALGVWLAFNYNKISYKWLVPLSGLSVIYIRSEEHTSELQSRGHLVCRLMLEHKKS